MGYVDFILNLAGLLVWLNWRSLRFDPLVKRTPATLMGTLRPAAPKKIRRWRILALLAGALVLRAVIYRWAAPFWIGRLDLGVTVPTFRSDQFPGMLLFSFLSFGLALGVFYIALLLLSLLKGPDPFHRVVKIPLGRVDDWPRWSKLLLPFAGAAIYWWLASWLVSQLPPRLPGSLPLRFQGGLVIGLQSYLVWKIPVAVLLLLHLLGSYIYFGRHPFWNYVDVTAQKLLRPLRKIPLRIGRVDFAPIVALTLLFLAAELAGRGLGWLYSRLPF